ncbi:hypothetical protein E4U58_001943, partial [Claviceps cyperi]
CEAEKDFTINGDAWEDTCQQYGVKLGYYPLDAAGRPDTTKPRIKVGVAVGSCPDRS